MLLIVSRRYFYCGYFCFMSWCLKLLAPYVCFRIPEPKAQKGKLIGWLCSVVVVVVVVVVAVDLFKDLL